MLDKLREGHDDIQREVLSQRSAMKRERFEIEAQLHQLRGELHLVSANLAKTVASGQESKDRMAVLNGTAGSDHDGDGDGEVVWIDEDEPFDLIVSRSEAVMENIEAKLAEFNGRIATIGEKENKNETKTETGLVCRFVLFTLVTLL